MQDADLFMELAGIAGVFVGFGALIAVRSTGPTEVMEIAYMRTLVAMGLLTVVAALAPVTLARYDLGDHDVWALCGALGLVGTFAMLAVSARTPEWRAGWAASTEGVRLTPGYVLYGAVYVLYVIALVLLPIIVMLGVAPDLEAAVYFTYVVLILVGAAWTLLALVYAQRAPQPASGQAEPPVLGAASL